jgi:hypothetical protein
MGVVGVGGSEALGVAGAAAFLLFLLRFARPPSLAAFVFGGALLPVVGVGVGALAIEGDSLGAGRPFCAAVVGWAEGPC